jgi:predicted acyltransferase
MSSSQRFLALDVFRGMTVCFMIIVNTPGDGNTTFSPLLHAKWHGFTPTDLVFPSFLFAVGNAMSFVMPKWADKSQATVLWKIIKRTLLIFLLGYLMYWFPFFRLDENNHVSSFPITETRILGVLQRIALCYGIASLMIWYLKPKWALITSIALLFLYWGLVFWFGDASDPLSISGNAGLKLDKWLMGDQRLYHGEGIAFDPEGWLSTLPAIANVIAGFTVGRFVQQKGKTYEGLTKLLLAGFGLLLLAYCWNFFFPINKKLWTSSFVLCTVGLDCIILATVIYLIEFRKTVNWTYFFEVFGKNTLFIYLLSELLVIPLYIITMEPGTSLYRWIFGHTFSYAGPYIGSLLFAIGFMLVCWTVGYLLDKKKIYIRV